MKKIYNTLAGWFPVGKKRKRVTIAVIASLCITVMTLTIFFLSSEIFADSASQADLSNFTTGIVIQDGAGNSIPPSGNVIVGNNYTLRISFKETPSLQFVYNAGVLTYQLPAGIIIPATVSNAPVYGTGGSGSVIGRYNITTGGKVTVWFDSVYASGLPAPGNFIDVYTNANFTLDILARFNGGGGPVSFDFGNNVIINVNLNPLEPYPQITKTSPNFDPATNTINYTVTVSARNGNLTIDTFSDWATAASLPIGTPPGSYLNLSSVKVDGAAVPPGDISWRAGSNPPVFDIVFPGGKTIPQNGSMTVTYTIDLTGYMQQQGYGSTNYSFIVHNEAAVTYQDPNGNPKTVKATRDVGVQKTFIKKSGTFVPDSPGAATGKITWTIEIGDGIADLAGRTVTDTLGPVFTDADRPAQVTLTLYDATKAQIGSPAPVSTALGAGNTFTFQIPGGIPVYYAAITYDIAIDISSSSATTVSFTNDVSIDLTNTPHTTGSSTAIKPGPMSNSNVTKKVKYIDENTLQYTIKLNVPASMAGEVLSLQDHLNIGAVSREIQNTPQNMKVTFNGVEYPEGPGTPYLWYLGSTLNPSTAFTGYWYMRFGITDPTGDAYNSTWPSDITWDTEIIITYELPLTAGLNYATEGIDVIGELIRKYGCKDYQLTNALYVRGYNTTTYGQSNAVINWPIYKNADAARPAVSGDTLEYEVVLNPTNAEYTRTNYSAGNNRLTFSLFQEGGPAIFFDEFDDRLEYVPGSFRVDVYAISASETGIVNGTAVGRYKYADAQQEAAFGIVSGNTLTADLADLTQISGTITDPNWYALKDNGVIGYGRQVYVFKVIYSLKVKASVLEAMVEPIELHNTAGFIGNSETHNGRFTSDSTVKYGKRPIEKTLTGTDGNIATFDIIVNPYGRQFDGGSNLCVTDRMNNTLAFYLTSLKAYTGSGLATPQALTQKSELDPNTAWTWTLTGENEITIVIPDATPVRIEYNALIKGTPNQNVQISNYVEVAGMYFDEYAGTWRVLNSSATGGGNYAEFLLLKNDESNIGRFLPGAKFALYIGWPDGYWSENEEDNRPLYGGTANPPIAPAGIDQTFTEDGYIYYYLDDDLTIGSGSILFTNGWLTNESVAEGAKYAVKELAPPPGYLLPSTTLTFVDLFSVTGTDYIALSNTPKRTSAEINGEKKIQGNPQSVPAFTFNLVQVTDATGAFLKFPLYQDSASQGGAGAFSFTLTDLAPGTYYYMITEAAGAASPYWTYDKAVYIVRVKVSADASGNLVSIVEYRCRTGESGPWSAWSGGVNNTVTFRNKYSDGTSAEITLRGSKAVTGAKAPGEIFAFTLTQWSAASLTGGSAIAGGVDETVTVATNGAGDYDVVFPEIILAVGGPYYFVVRETPGSADGWKYDGAAWLYTVVVSGSPPTAKISLARQSG